MIIDRLPLLRAKEIILGSQSPRRKEILTLMGLSFETRPSNFDENLSKSEFPTPSSYATATATGKALDVYRSLPKKPDLIIGSDTVVVLDGQILEKPKSEGEAIRMLQMMSGRDHKVVTAVTLVTKLGDVRTFHEETLVWFAPLSDEAISAYVQTKEPMDKAGAYGIQGMGGTFVTKIQGCYFCVMGLPMHALAREINKLMDEGLV